MKILIKFFFAAITLMSCDSKSQNTKITKPNTSPKMNTIKTPLKNFDVKEFEKKLKADSSYEGYETEDGTDIMQISYLEDDEELGGIADGSISKRYSQTERKKDRFEDTFIFDENGILIKHSQHFSDVETGNWETYSKDGKVLTEVNKDEYYPFSINKVVEFSKKHRGDLSKNGSLKRFYDKELKKYIYEIEWIVDEPSRSYSQAYILDGINGKIIKDFEKSVPWIGR